LNPEDVTRLLHFDPTETAAKGSKTTSSAGKTRTAPTGRWILETDGRVDSSNLEDHVEWLLDRLATAAVAPSQIPGVSSADIFCYWVSATGQGGPEFSPEILGRLAKLQLTLGLDIYFDSSNA
jgi:hypothetical protein